MRGMKPTALLRLISMKITLAGMAILLLGSCTFSLVDMPNLFPATQTPSYGNPPPATPMPRAEMTFQVTLPAPLLPGESLVLSVVDEVTGLSMNPVNHAMQAVDGLHYTVTIQFPVHSVVKYRYIKQASFPQLEDDPLDRPIRYRMVHVNGMGSVTDTIASWVGEPFSGSTGRVSGTVTDTNGVPLTNIMVVIGGQQVLSDSTGTFVLDPVLASGTQNLVAYALDGGYSTFQQGAVIGSGQLTKVRITMAEAALVNMVFTVIVPGDTIGSVPIRMAGNLLQLGNTFADLNGGLSTVATRMPTLTPMADGRYSLSLMLPAGADVHYKYTLGDGFWNAEHNTGGGFVVRQLIVPQSQESVAVGDLVQTWQAGGNSSPISFEVSVPDSTPVTDIISIQFNPYGWTEPIPMWPLGNHKWVYTLYSPLNMLGSFEYRYCRNDQCGVADDASTPAGHIGRQVTTSLAPQDLRDTVQAWAWMEKGSDEPVVGVSVQARSPFWAGIEFQNGYDPTWQAWMPLALQNVQGIHADWVVLTPSWSYSLANPDSFSPLPGRDPLWNDTVETIKQARAGNLNVAIFPTAQFPVDADQWWLLSSSDATWWNTWFERYQAFALYHADLAAMNGAQALILGGEWIVPALPGSQGAATDAGTRWTALVAAVRGHYQGPLFWALEYSGGAPAIPGFVSLFDGIYVLWNTPLSTADTPTVAELQTRAGELLDSDLLPLSTTLNKPIIIALASPSVNGTAIACLPDGGGGCLAWTVLNQPAVDQTGLTLNLRAQADVTQALLGAINERAWLGGFVSRGYYPPVSLLDKSASVHGKPAADLLWYWFKMIRGISP